MIQKLHFWTLPAKLAAGGLFSYTGRFDLELMIQLAVIVCIATVAGIRIADQLVPMYAQEGENYGNSTNRIS
jgi:hypothetical protein